MDIRRRTLLEYLTAYRDTLGETAVRFIEPGDLTRIFWSPILTGGLRGFMSTTLGAGFEHLPGSPGLSVVLSVDRVEQQFFGGPKQLTRLGSMFRISEGAEVTMIGATIEGAYPPIVFSEPRGMVRLLDMRFVAEGWARDAGFVELHGSRFLDHWSQAAAITRAKDEVLRAVVDLQLARRRELSLADYLSTFKQQLVLILGDYSLEGRARLQAIADELESLGYEPVMLDEIPDDIHYDLRQKAVAVGSVARFVVVDDSSKAGQLVEHVYAEQNRWVTVVLRGADGASSFVLRGAEHYSRVLREITYRSGGLAPALSEGVKWAEDTLRDVVTGGLSTYPWRTAT